MNEDQITKPKRDYLLPGSILIAAVLVAGSLVYSAGKSSGDPNLQGNLGGSMPSQNNKLDSIRPVSENDHVLGDLNAAVKVVEFSDLECPFCKNFHLTMKQVLKDYDGRVSWVYRHFPLSEIHSKAIKEAEATECAAELGGNQKFWDYVDRIFAVTPSNDGLDLSKLPEIAKDLDLDEGAFNKCLEEGRYVSKVTKDREEALGLGAEGTPYSIVLGKNGKQYLINGALPYARVKAIIDEALK